MDKRTLSVVAVLLTLALTIAGYWGWRQNQLYRSLALDQEDMQEELGSVNALKEELKWEVDSLQKAYLTLAEENETLQGSLADNESRLARKDAELRAAQKNVAGQANSLRAEIQNLLAIKNELESSINQLQTENDSLKVRTGALERDLNLAQEEKVALSNLNQTIQGELRRLTLANFKATAFQVEVEGRRPVATSRSGKARRVLVTFDLTGVPTEYQGIRPLYLVITNDKGVPVGGSDIQAKSVVNGQVMDLLAVKAKDVNITANQRLSFTHDLEDRLRSGFYRVSVYTDIGLLGAASFRLQ